MDSLINGIAVYTLLVCLGVAAGAAGAALLFIGTRRWLTRCAPLTRQRVLLALFCTPVLGVLVLTLSMSAPAVWFSSGESLAHCSAHAITHGALCRWHVPQVVLPPWLIATVLLALSLAVIASVTGLARMAASQRRLHLMQQMATWQDTAGYLLLPMRQPLAFAAGLTRGRVFISEGLRTQLHSEQLDIVLAHERAHIRHRDMLVTVLIETLARLQLPGVSAAMRRAWHLAVEQRCDEAVARQTGDRLAVADCLLAVARLQQSVGHEPVPAGANSLLDGNLTTRVTALLAEPVPSRTPPLLSIAGLGVLILTALLAGGPSLHRLLELLLPSAGL